MTFMNMIEQILEDFPSIKEAHAKIEINTAYKELVKKSRILRDKQNLTLVSGTHQYALPIGCISVYRVDYKDSDGTMKKVNGIYVIEHDTIEFFRSNGSPYTDISGDANIFTLHFYKYPAELSLDTDEPVIDDGLHEGILAIVRSKLYSRIPMIETTLPGGGKRMDKDWNAVKFWKNEASDYLREALKEAAKQKDDTPYNVRGAQY